MIRNNAIAFLALAAGLAAPATAGMLTMSADAASGADDWAGYQGYSMVLTIDSDDLDVAGSASAFTLQGWNFTAFDAEGTEVFAATGSETAFSAHGTGPTFSAVIALDAASITMNALDPMADYLAFSYDFTVEASLDAAINASALTARGALTLGTSLGGGGDLTGLYTVPAPSAVAVIGACGLMARRRRR